jgi:hypothetical protein
MYAGASGSSHGINKMAPGLGNNKWQGIAPTGQKRSGVVRHIQTNAWGNNYTGVYCFNALGGGVGRRSNMFASNADGAKKDCQGYVEPVPVPAPSPTVLDLDPAQTLQWLQGTLLPPPNSYSLAFPSSAQHAVVFLKAQIAQNPAPAGIYDQINGPLQDGQVTIDPLLSGAAQETVPTLLFPDNTAGTNIVYAAIDSVSGPMLGAVVSPTVLRPSDGALYYVYYAIKVSTYTFVDAATSLDPLASTSFTPAVTNPLFVGVGAF